MTIRARFMVEKCTRPAGCRVTNGILGVSEHRMDLLMNPVKLILILAAVLLAAPAPGAGMTLEQIAHLQSVDEMALSPDGSLIAFTLSVPRDLRTQKDGPAWQELHLIDRDGKQRAFISGKVNVRSIAWHPDGGMISFIATRGEDKQAALWGIAVDGGEARRLAGVG